MMETKHGAPPLVILAIVGICLLMAGLSAADVGLVTAVHNDHIPFATVVSATAPRWIVFAALLSDRFGSKLVYAIGAFTGVVWPFPMFALVNTGEVGLAMVASVAALATRARACCSVR